MKIIVTGPEFINNKLEICKMIAEQNDDFIVGQKFTSDKDYQNIISEDYLYYMSKEDIHLSFKNNSLLYIEYIEDTIYGITLDSFYNSNLINIELYNINNIPNQYLTDQVVIVYLDSKNHSTNLHKDIVETKYLFDRINELNLKYLYFLDEDIKDIFEVINKFIYSDEETQKLILNEYN
jgi:hypothetical protein